MLIFYKSRLYDTVAGTDKEVDKAEITDLLKKGHIIEGARRFCGITEFYKYWGG